MTTGLAISRDALLEHARTLPAAPQILAGLCELLQEVNTGLDEISDEIRKDPALAARVIRISNSVIFGGGMKVGSVDDAVNRVGFSELLRLVGAATAAGLVERSLICYGVGAEKLRESVLLHALAAEALASYAGVDPRIAYTGGLLRSLGMMVLDRAVRGRIAPTDGFDPVAYATYAEWEQARFGLTGSEVATMILDEWRFSAELVAAVGDHLLPREESFQDRLACVLNVAGAIVANAGLALQGEKSYWVVTPEKLRAAGLNQEEFEIATEQATALFRQQRAALS